MTFDNVGLLLSITSLAVAAAALLIVVLFPILFTVGGALRGDMEKFLGGFFWQNFAYAMWEQLLGVDMIVSLTVLFHEHLNRGHRLTREAAAASYATYILHAPVVVLVTLAVRGVELYPLLKFALIALIVVPLSFALGAALCRLPLARDIL